MVKREMTEQDVMDEEVKSPKVIALEKDLAELKRENEKLKRQAGTDEALFESIQDGVSGLALEPYARLPVPELDGDHDEHQAAVMISDTHSDEFVRAEEMEGIAEHTWEIHEERMAITADKVLEMTGIMRKSAPVDVLNVWVLGDLFLGEIHPEETAYGSEMTLPVALPSEARVLADTVLRMAAGFKQVRVVGLCGNHGRNSRKPVMKMTADRNWDYSVYLIAQELTRNAENVEWVLPKSIMHVEEVLGQKYLLTHGNVANVTHRTPYFGIENSFFSQRNARRKTDLDFDHVFMGHFHHSFGLRGFINGVPSMIGANQFSLYRMHCATPAAQELVFLTEKHGPTARWTIEL